MDYCPYCGSRSEINNFMSKYLWKSLKQRPVILPDGEQCNQIDGHESCTNSTGHSHV